MADHVQTLAQLLAQNKAANTQQIGNPQAGQMNFQTGTVNAGYGAAGEAFGKGMSDYVNQTFVAAQKNKYLQENDPIEIEKRASKFYDIYNNAPVEEQDKIDKWLNETPEGLKWLDKLNKNAGHLMTKVPLPKDYVPKPGEAPDDVTWYRPLRTIKTHDQQRNEATMKMDPGKRENVLFAQEAERIANTGLLGARAASEPITAAAQTTSANAQMKSAQAHESQAKTAQDLLQYQIQAEKARTSYLTAKEKTLVAAKDPLGQKLVIQRAQLRQKMLVDAGETFRNETTAISKLYTKKEKVERTWLNQAKYASTIVANDPLSQTAVNMYADTLNDISSKNEDTNSTQWYQLGLNVLDSWEANCNSYKSYSALFKAKNRFIRQYWEQRYPGMSMPNVEKAIRAEMEAMKPKVKDVVADEARLKQEKREAEQIQVAMPPAPEFGGIQ